MINMVGVHAAYLLFTGEYSARLWRAYTFFFLVGTYGALQVPIIGMAPFKSLEQLGMYICIDDQYNELLCLIHEVFVCFSANAYKQTISLFSALAVP